MPRRGRYIATLIVGIMLVGHAFLYDGVLMEAQLVSFFDPVGALSPLPWGTYHVGTGIAYVTAAVLGFWGTERRLSLRAVGLIIGGGLLASSIGVYAFWANADTIWGGWAAGFIFAPAQIVLFPLLGIWARTTSEERPSPDVFTIPLHYLFAAGSVLILLPVLVFAGAGVVAGGWNMFDAFGVAVLLVLNMVFGYPLYRLGRGVSIVD